LKSQRVPWTARAAANTLSEVMRVAMSAGLAPITARCREAMASSWKGLNLGTMPMNGAVTGRTTTTRPRNLPDQIAGYTPDPKWSNP